ncbi:MAG: hypothetical protein U0804_28810 [Gemmataceae bacterium]
MLVRCLNPDCSEADNDGPPVFDFEADEPKCPKCGADQRTAPQTVVTRATIHYLVNDPKGGIRTPHGGRAVACDPAGRKLPKHATAVPDAVTCPECRASAVYREHVAGTVDQSQQISPGVPPQAASGTIGG